MLNMIQQFIEAARLHEAIMEAAQFSPIIPEGVSLIDWEAYHNAMKPFREYDNILLRTSHFYEQSIRDDDALGALNYLLASMYYDIV